jgi:hypothetical protein
MRIGSVFYSVLFFGKAKDLAKKYPYDPFAAYTSDSDFQR